MMKIKKDMKQFQKNKKVPLGQGMMVCKGWKGGTIKKYPNTKEKYKLMFQEKSENCIEYNL